IQAVHSLAEANISDIIRALNGAPLPETPIATTVLPEVPMPAATPQATAPQPAPQAPAPQPEPAQAPAPEPQPAPQPAARTLEPIDDAPPLFSDDAPPPDTLAAPQDRPLTAELWEQLLDEVRRLSPLHGALIGITQFISDDDGRVSVAIHPQDIDTRDALYSEEISGLIREVGMGVCGHAVKVSVVTDDSLPAPQPPEAPPAPEAVVEQAPAKPAPAEEKPQPAPSLRPSDDEFYQDPLIQQALDTFQATLIKQNPTV
ncbi:MAG: hypothetical protein MJ058_10235, partial [Akkermansia sp.]|nr:hypothetical protein [Akkermansia sp.]